MEMDGHTGAQRFGDTEARLRQPDVGGTADLLCCTTASKAFARGLIRVRDTCVDWRRTISG